MPASGVSMDAGSGMGLPPPPPPPAEAKPEGWANPAVVGLMGFGTTTMLAGLSNMPAPYVNGFAANWVVFGMALFFGGIAQLLAGVIALRKGNLFAGSAFVGYGSFWLAYFYTLNSAGGAALATTPVLAYGLAGFSFIWMMFTFTFMINAPKHGWGILLVFVLLFISFVVLVVKFASIASDPVNSPFVTSGGSGADNWVVAIPIIAAGLMAWYVATATLTNWNYGRRVLPE